MYEHRGGAVTPHDAAIPTCPKGWGGMSPFFNSLLIVDRVGPGRPGPTRIVVR